MTICPSDKIADHVPFPETIDSTMLGTFRACPQKYFRQYMQHYKPRGESVHLIAGGAFAEGVEYARRAFYIDGKTPKESEAAGIAALLRKYGDYSPPIESAKSVERMVGALVFYFDRWPLGQDGAVPIDREGVRGIEYSFAEPFPFLHPVTRDPLLYTGRADMLAHYAGGRFAFDEKTTTSLGARWADQWEMRSQFTGYCWASKNSGYDIQGVLVRGVCIQKTQYNTAEVVTYRPQHVIDRWLEQSVRDLQRLQRMWEENYYDYDLDHACNEYGGCAFKRVCTSQNPESWLKTDFEIRIWDPLKREEVAVNPQEYVEEHIELIIGRQA